MNDNDNELRLSTGLNIQNLCGPVKDTKGNLIFEGISPLVMALYIMFKHTESVNNGIPFIKLINVPNLDEIYELSETKETNNTIFYGKAAIIQCVENRILNVLKKALTKNSSDTNKDIIIKLEKTIQSMFSALKLHTSNNMFTNTSGTIKSLLLILSALGSEEYNSIQNINDLSKVDIKIKRAAQYFFSKINISIFNDDKTKNAYLYKEFQKLYNKTEVKSEELKAFDILTIDPTMIIKGITNFIKFIDIYSNSNALLNELDSSKISTASYSTPAPKGSPQKLTDSDNSDNGSVLDYSEYIKLNLKQEINDLFDTERYTVLFKICKLLQKDSANKEQLNTFYDQELELIKKMFAIDSEDKASLNLIHNLVLERIDAAEESILTKELVIKVINSNTHNDELLLKLLLENPENLENPSFNNIKQQEINKQFIELKQENSLERFINTQQEFITDVSKLNFGEYNKLQKELLNNVNYLDNKLAIDEIQKQKAIKDSSQERKIVKYSDKDALPLMSEVPQNNESDQHSSRNELNESIHNTPNRGEGEEGNRESENSSPRSETDKSENVTPNIPAEPKLEEKFLTFGNGSDKDIEDDEINITSFATIKEYFKAPALLDTTESYDFIDLTFVKDEIKKPIRGIDEVLNELNNLINAIEPEDLNLQPEIVDINRHFNDGDAMEFLKSNRPDELLNFNNQYINLSNFAGCVDYYRQVDELNEQSEDKNLNTIQERLQGKIEQYRNILQLQLQLINKHANEFTIDDTNQIKNNSTKLVQIKQEIDQLRGEKNDLFNKIQNKYDEIQNIAVANANELASGLIKKQSTAILNDQAILDIANRLLPLDDEIYMLRLDSGKDNFFTRKLYSLNNRLLARVNNLNIRFQEDRQAIENFNCEDYNNYLNDRARLKNLHQNLLEYPETMQNSFNELFNSFITNREQLLVKINNIKDKHRAVRENLLAQYNAYSNILVLNTQNNVIQFQYFNNEGRYIQGDSGTCNFDDFNKLIKELNKQNNDLTDNLEKNLSFEDQKDLFLNNNIEFSNHSFDQEDYPTLINNITVLNQRTASFLENNSITEENRIILQENQDNQDNLYVYVLNLANNSNATVAAYKNEFDIHNNQLQLLKQQLSETQNPDDFETFKEKIIDLIIRNEALTLKYENTVASQNQHFINCQKSYLTFLDNFEQIESKEREKEDKIQLLLKQSNKYFQNSLRGGCTLDDIVTKQNNLLKTISANIKQEPSILKRIALFKIEGLRRAQETAQKKVINKMLNIAARAENDSQHLKAYLKYNEIGVGCNHSFKNSKLELCSNLAEIEGKHNLVYINGKYYAVLKNIDVTNNNLIREGSFTLVDLGLTEKPTLDIIEGILVKRLYLLRTQGIGKETQSYLFNNLEEIKTINPEQDIETSYQKPQARGYIIKQASKEVYDNSLQESIQNYNNKIEQDFDASVDFQEFINDSQFKPEEIDLFKLTSVEQDTQYVLPIKQVLQQNDCLVPIKAENAFTDDVNNFAYKIKFNEIDNNFKLTINEQYQNVVKDGINNFAINNTLLANTFNNQKVNSVNQLNALLNPPVAVPEANQDARGINFAQLENELNNLNPPEAIQGANNAFDANRVIE